ncbi:MAG: gamma-glutamylcyclotransferase [Zoogloeaceae bacterium]|nr:gamma-glutamylcyclotransferase [Zoogloeaceae bacterium]
MSVHVFAYGTLMCADIMRTACGGLPAAEPARLDGFSRHPVAGEEYPGIRRNAGASVHGVLYRDVTIAQLAQLDVFEGPQYLRESTIAILADGSTLDAETYVFADHQLHLLQDGDWDYFSFLERGRRRFEGRYLGFERI